MEPQPQSREPELPTDATPDEGAVCEEELPFFTTRGRTLFLYLVYCSGVVVCIHLLHAWYGDDPLAIPLLHGPYISIDSWSAVHLMVFFGVGVLFPGRMVSMFLYGLAWEMLEFVMQSNKPFREFWSEPTVNTIWDLWFNAMGYRLGEWYVVRLVKRRRLERKKE
eukprot:m.31099 g.31099  ORF g.31099 m.31099 type:complete len:165 (-) comp12410_c0_seq1:80-574(-)